MLKCLISYLWYNCFEFCKHIWPKRKLARCVAWYGVCDECGGGVFRLVEKTTCQSGSFNWTNNNFFKSCVGRLLVSPNLLRIWFCTMQYCCIFVFIWTLLCVNWTLLRELMFYLELQWTCPANKVRNINTKMESNVRHYMRSSNGTAKAVCCVTCAPPSPSSVFLMIPIVNNKSSKITMFIVTQSCDINR